MTDPLHLKIPLPACPKKRPRLGRDRQGNSRVHNEPAFEKWKIAVRTIALLQAKGRRFTGPVRLDLTIHPDALEITISDDTANRVRLRGDLDNLSGGLLDALQPKRRRFAGRSLAISGGIFEDDRQVVMLTAQAAPKG